MNVTGSLYVKNNIWQMMINYYDENGKRKQKSKSTGLPVRSNKKKAQQMLDELLHEYNNDETKLLSKDILFSDYMLQWIEEHKNKIRENTYDNYVTVIKKHIAPYFAKKRITVKELRPRHLREYYKYKLKTLSATTVKKHHSKIHKALKSAMVDELISHNPADAVELPSIEKFEGDYYNEDEIQILKELVKGTKIEVPVMLTTYYGFRRSEVLGLRWQSIDFDRGTIHVEHTVNESNGKIIAADKTKSKESNRYMPMDDEVRHYLEEVKNRQDENRKFYGNRYEESGYVCTYENGAMMKPSYLSQRFRELLEKNADKIKRIRFHDLRHSSATRLLALGFCLEDIKAWLGHADIATTQRYAHYMDERKMDMLNRLNQKAS